MEFTTGALYRQSPGSVDFRKPGTFSIVLNDGLIVTHGCGLDGSATWFGPFPPAGCPLGATAYIASGDLNNDGVRDDFTYWELVNVIPAAAIEPDHPELCKVYSHPPSKFPMDMLGRSHHRVPKSPGC